MRERNLAHARRVVESELPPEKIAPYVRHVDDKTIALEDGSVMRVWRLRGLPAEALSQVIVNQVAIAHNSALRSLAHGRAALWTHLVRRRLEPIAARATNAPAFVEELYGRYEAALSGNRLYQNTFYVSLVVKAAPLPVGLFHAWVTGKRKTQAATDADLELIDDLGTRMETLLAPYGVRPLRLVERDGLLFSEPAEALRSVLTGRHEAVPLVRGDLGRSMMNFRPILTGSALEVRDAGSARFAGMVSIFDYPARTRLGMLDRVAEAPFELVLTQSFTFLQKAKAHAMFEKRRRQMENVGDKAVTQAALLIEASDEMENGAFCVGGYHLTLTAFEADVKALPKTMSAARGLLSDAGIVAAREDLSLIESWIGQLPGNFKHMAPRRAEAITSQGFADLCPYHSFSEGRDKGVHWGYPVAYLRTSAASRYAFNFHVRDVGHTLVLGATGAGKSVLLTFMLSGLMRLNASVVLFDKDRGAEVFIGVNGGRYLRLHLGVPTGAAPFKAMDVYTERYRAFLVALVQRLVSDDPRSLTAEDKTRIETAVRSVERMPRQLRGIGAIAANLGGVGANDIGRRLQRWCRGGELGWVLDAEEDLLPFEAGTGRVLLGFDLVEILKSDEAREPLLMYLFERLDQMVDGRRLVWAVEEFHAALNDASVRRQVDNALRTWRKRNGMAILVSQNPGDAVRSEIGETLVLQTPTKIYLPNPEARREDYVGKLSCLDREFDLIQRLGITSRKFLVCQRDPDTASSDGGAALTGGLAASVLCDLDLRGFDKYLRALSPQAERGDYAAWDRAQESGGDTASLWHRFCEEGGLS